MTEEEFKKKVDEFMGKYKELVDEYQIDFASFPMFVPDSQGAFKVVMQSRPVDISQQAVRSPFIPQ